MSEYQYTDYKEARLKAARDQNTDESKLMDEFCSALDRVELQDFLNHQREQFTQALEADSVDHRWLVLRDHTENAGRAAESGSIKETALAFMALGRAIEAVSRPSRMELLDLYQAKLRTMTLDAPLDKLNIHKRFLKRAARIMAEGLWFKDTDQTIRVSEACEHIFPAIVELARQSSIPDDCYPDRASGLKDWLRPIAPDYARKGGRPPKKKK